MYFYMEGALFTSVEFPCTFCAVVSGLPYVDNTYLQYVAGSEILVRQALE